MALSIRARSTLTYLLLGLILISSAARAEAKPTSDEFGAESSLATWSIRNAAEPGRPIEHAVVDLNRTAPGQLALIPRRGAWNTRHTGPFIYQSVTGNFLISAKVDAHSRADPTQPPSSPFNSAGVMARSPASAGGPQGQSWVSYTLGFQDTQVGTSAESTIGSTQAIVERQPTGGVALAVLRLCRVGPELSTWYSLDGERTWTAGRVFVRADVPPTLEVGLISNSVGAPHDLQADFDFARFGVPSTSADCTLPLVAGGTLTGSKALGRSSPAEDPGSPRATEVGPTPRNWSSLSDEFADPSTLKGWTLLDERSLGWVDVHASAPGKLTMIPDGVTQDDGGGFLFKSVTGDFVVEVEVSVGRLWEPSLPPRGPRSRAGLLVRDPSSTGPGGARLVTYELVVDPSRAWSRGIRTTRPAAGGTSSTEFVNGAKGTDGKVRLRICRAGAMLRFFHRPTSAAAWVEEMLTRATVRTGSGAVEATAGTASGVLGAPIQLLRTDLPARVLVGPMVGNGDSPLETRAEFGHVRFGAVSSPADCVAPLVSAEDE